MTCDSKGNETDFSSVNIQEHICPNNCHRSVQSSFDQRQLQSGFKDSL